MLLSKYVPLRASVLVRVEYLVNGLILNQANPQILESHRKQIVVEKCGPDCKLVKVGDFVDVAPDAVRTYAKDFIDNKFKLSDVKETVRQLAITESKSDPRRGSAINKEFEFHGYMLLPENEIIALTNGYDDEKDLRTDSKVIIPIGREQDRFAKGVN